MYAEVDGMIEEEYVAVSRGKFTARRAPTEEEKQTGVINISDLERLLAAAEAQPPHAPATPPQEG